MSILQRIKNLWAWSLFAPTKQMVELYNKPIIVARDYTKTNKAVIVKRRPRDVIKEITGE